MTHLTHDTLVGFLRDELDDSANAFASEHIEACAECERRLEALASNDLPEVMLTSSVREEERTEIHESPSKSKPAKAAAHTRRRAMRKPQDLNSRSKFSWKAFIFGALVIVIPIAFAAPVLFVFLLIGISRDAQVAQAVVTERAMETRDMESIAPAIKSTHRGNIRSFTAPTVAPTPVPMRMPTQPVPLVPKEVHSPKLRKNGDFIQPAVKTGDRQLNDLLKELRAQRAANQQLVAQQQRLTAQLERLTKMLSESLSRSESRDESSPVRGGLTPELTPQDESYSPKGRDAESIGEAAAPSIGETGAPSIGESGAEKPPIKLPERIGSGAVIDRKPKKDEPLPVDLKKQEGELATPESESEIE